MTGHAVKSAQLARLGDLTEQASERRAGARVIVVRMGVVCTVVMIETHCVGPTLVPSPVLSLAYSVKPPHSTYTEGRQCGPRAAHQLLPCGFMGVRRMGAIARAGECRYHRKKVEFISTELEILGLKR